MKIKLSVFLLSILLIAGILISQDKPEESPKEKPVKEATETTNDKSDGEPKEKVLTLTEKIQANFKSLVGDIWGVLLWPVPMFDTGENIVLNQVPNLHLLTHDIQSEKTELFKYLKSIISQNEDDLKILNAFKYHKVMDDDLIEKLSKSFGIDKAYLQADHNRFIIKISKPLALENAKSLIKVIPEGIRGNFTIPFKSEKAVSDFITKTYFSNKKEQPSEKVISVKAIELSELCLIVDKLPGVSADIKSKLSSLKFTNEVDTKLSVIIFKILNASLQDKLIVDNVTDLKKFIADKKLPDEKTAILIRDFYTDKKILLSRADGVPLLILVLALGGVIFTLLYGFIGFKGVKHSIDVLRGKYDNPDDEGEISHFQALTSALSATVGLGNIGGVAIAVAVGGPGAIFWMWLTALFGMTSKFSSCMFAQVYREVDPKTGAVKGGPMYYLSKGIADLYPSIAWLGKVLAVIFAVFCIFGSLGGGNMYQGNQTYAILSSTFQLEGDKWKWIIGFILAFGVGLVIIGGIKKIGNFTSKVVPFMCIFYVGTCGFIILSHFGDIPGVFVSIFEGAFNFKSALFGGFIGIFIQGVKRAAFSNEAGLGSAAIAHAAAKTDEPVREGMVAMIGPFIDTIIICTMTALTILITKAHLSDAGAGVLMTNAAFATLGSVFPYLLAIAVFFFAFSSVISWCYYGEKSTEYLFGTGSIRYFRIFFVCCVVLGPVFNLGAVIDFSDAMLLSMAFPNILGGLLLYKKGRVLLKDYWDRYKSGEMKTYK
ncbi:MAG: hypothetical protein COA79_24990 [Planctomycetota bacterium]|nr:MAG: hypothetical protein COA79_24990 [Planctomycetota bacterium]